MTPSHPAIARLTENEKQCLRRRLMPQTAKEMAIELGISPHAVEKRLKMARAKLGVSSSLEAARMLAAIEQGGDRLVPQPPDLAGPPPALDEGAGGRAPGLRRILWIPASGVVGMSIIVAVALALVGQEAGPPPEPPAILRESPARRPATAEQAIAFLESSFATTDRDGSGFIEPEEAPAVHRRAGDAGSGAPMVAVPGRQGQMMWIAHADRDGDGKVDRAEFVGANRGWVEARGVPARWKPRS